MICSWFNPWMYNHIYEWTEYIKKTNYKLQSDFWLLKTLVPLTSALFKGQPYYGNLRLWLIFSRSALAILISLSFHTHFRISLSICIKNVCWDFEWDCTEPVDHIENSHLNNIESSNLWLWNVFSVIYLLLFFNQCFVAFLHRFCVCIYCHTSPSN